MPIGQYEHKPRNTLSSLLARCEKNDNGCLLWPGKPNETGYGRAGWKGKVYLSHVLIWRLVKGPVPEGKELHHDCRTPLCCNVDHLIPVTKAEHAAAHPEHTETRAWRSRLTHCKRGHEFTPENTRIDKRGERGCRQCRREQNKQWMKENFRRLPSYQNRKAAEKAGRAGRRLETG